MAVSKAAFSVLSPAGPRGRLSVLMFHRVLAQADALFPSEVDAERFGRICQWLSGWAHVLPLDEAVARLAQGSLPARALALTFDDGYADNDAIALPLLKAHGLCATFFIASGFLGQGRMWNDRVIEAVRHAPPGELDCRQLLQQEAACFGLSDAASRRAAINSLLAAIKYRPLDERIELVSRLEAQTGGAKGPDLMMDDAGVKRLRDAGMQIGAHTVSHPILATLDANAARAEIGDSKRYLEDLLREPVTLFAYPNGKPGQDYTPQSVQIVKELGFEGAVSTAWGAARGGDERFELPRFTPWDHSRLRYRGRLLANLMRR